MQAIPQHAEVLEKLVAWGEARPKIRALILTSSLARPGGPVDILTDYDLILAVTNPEHFAQNDSWVFDYGIPMVRWGDDSTLLSLTTYFRGVIYADYAKVDYTIWPDALLERIAEQEALPEELDEGYRILLDKDGRTAQWKQPTHKAFIPAKPTAAEYQALIEEFWWSATYVAKSLWRDEMIFARWVLDEEMKVGTLRKLLEWRIEINHNWALRPGVFGRGLKQRIPLQRWTELTDTYVGLERDENWRALFQTMKLFRQVALEVADALGYAYPQAQDEQVHAYLNTIRQLPSER